MALVGKKPIELLVSMRAHDQKTSLKLFLCKATVGNYRVSVINDETIVDINQKHEKYKPVDAFVQSRIMPEQFYTLILSTFQVGQNIGGIMTVESSQPVQVMAIQKEGTGMTIERMPSQWH